MVIVSIETMVICMDGRSNSKMLYFLKISRDYYERLIEEKAIECGISKQEADLLLFFSNNLEFDRACDAVNYRGFSKAYVSKALSLLSKRGFIEVCYDEFDKRYQRIVILDSANEIINELKGVQSRFYQCLHKGISKKDFETYLSVVDKIAQNVVNDMRG